jgi:hypothetical protein
VFLTAVVLAGVSTGLVACVGDSTEQGCEGDLRSCIDLAPDGSVGRDASLIPGDDRPVRDARVAPAAPREDAETTPMPDAVFLPADATPPAADVASPAAPDATPPLAPDAAAPDVAPPPDAAPPPPPDAALPPPPDAQLPDAAPPDAGCVPTPEVCDAVDQDCDGEIDEGALGESGPAILVEAGPATGPHLAWMDAEAAVVIAWSSDGEVRMRRVDLGGQGMEAGRRLGDGVAPRVSAASTRGAVAWTDPEGAAAVRTFEGRAAPGRRLDLPQRAPAIQWAGVRWLVPGLAGGADTLQVARVTPDGASDGHALVIAAGRQTGPISTAWSGGQLLASFTAEAPNGAARPAVARFDATGSLIRMADVDPEGAGPVQVAFAPSQDAWLVGWIDRAGRGRVGLFDRLSLELLGDAAVVADAPATPPAVAWAGGEGAAVWADPAGTVWFVRLEGDAVEPGLPFEVARRAHADAPPALAWTGRGYGATWASAAGVFYRPLLACAGLAPE